MTTRHQNKLEDKRLDASREDEWRRFERDNLAGLQEAIQRGMRATGKCCLQMDKLATEGKELADWICRPRGLGNAAPVAGGHPVTFVQNR